MGRKQMILLDTHALVWYLDDPEKLSQKSREAIDTGLRDDGVGIADITLWEIAMLVHKGRLTFDRDVEQWLTDLSELPNFRKFRISPPIAALSARLPGKFHGDPADRLIVATALNIDAPLVTRDGQIRDYSHIKTIW
ncbi:MAG: type II toxin-antitoxin system VapC family toxin [Gemmatimonadetes bacterium]|nr:type II toxin-antitoxin system VapC family toxin [Gemmatimonadota bacterium]